VTSSDGGTSEARRLVASAHTAGRLGPSWILSGEAGIGKRAFADWMVTLRWCEAESGVERPCGACRSCRQVATGNHPDHVVVHRDPPTEADPHGVGSKFEITVGQVREMVLAHLSLRAVEGHGRVVIVDGADDLNEEAQNALLKVLEEPPPGSLLLLVTAREESLLDTVRSRCHELRLSPLGDEAMAAAAPDAPPALRRLARGRPGRVEAWAGVEVGEVLGALDGFLTGHLSGPALGRALEAALASASDEGGDETASRRLLLELVHQRVRDAALCAAGGPAEGPTGALPPAVELPPIDRLFDMETALMQALTDVRRHLPPSVSLTALGTGFERARMGAGAASKRYT
jgi:DNA polymerase-3 subunit delta'